MNITIICDVLGKANNGTTIAALNLINSMSSKGHNVNVVCSDEYRRNEKGYYIVKKYNLGPFNKYLAKNGVSLSKPDETILTEAIKNANVVHCMVPFSLSRKAMKIAKRMGIPVTAGFHCQAENFTNHIFLMNSSLANKITYHNFYNKFYKYCTSVHYPTQFICQIFENATAPTNHYIISNGVSSSFRPIKTIRPSEFKDKFILLFTGRYSKEKSHDILIDAVALSHNKDRIQLVFAGCGPRKEYLERYSKKLPIAPIFKFFSRDELIKILNIADLYIHPAEIEIEAISCLEAISCGCVPIINNSPRCATKNFAIDEYNLFKYNDAHDLARKIDYWLANPTKKACRSKEYADYSSQFDFNTCMDKMERMLKDAAKM